MAVRAGNPTLEDGALHEADEIPSIDGRAVSSLIAIGFEAEAFVPGQAEIASFVEQPTRADVEALVDATAKGLEATGHVIAIYPAWAAEPALRRLETVRMAFGNGGFATYATSLPPLAGGVLAGLASAVARHVPSPGMLVAGLSHLEHELMIYAWTGSVAGLERPSPSLIQHLWSWLPRTAFGICLQPEPIIKRLRPADQSIPVPTTYRPMCVAIAAQSGSDESWAKEVVGAGLGTPPVKTVAPTVHGPKWWGTARLVEVVAYPIDVPVVARRITQHLTASLCTWCGEAIASDACPFCGLARSAPKTRSAS